MTTASPTPSPTAPPTLSPTPFPTVSPTSGSPTISPTSASPTLTPTSASPTLTPPTASPTTMSPTATPTTASPTTTTTTPTMTPTSEYERNYLCDKSRSRLSASHVAVCRQGIYVEYSAEYSLRRIFSRIFEMTCAEWYTSVNSRRLST
eukprot:769762-Prorocentrum_minimum.AAC.1